jgi:hypothetical protein
LQEVRIIEHKTEIIIVHTIRLTLYRKNDISYLYFKISEYLINEEDENNVGITCLKVYNQTSDVNAEIDMEAVPIVVIGAE